MNGNEEKKAYLSSYQEEKQKACRLALVLGELCEINPRRYMPGISSKRYKKDLFECVTKYEELVKKITLEKNEALSKLEPLHHQIEKVDGENERKVLELRYLQGKTWEAIAEEMMYSYGNVHRIHNRALEKLLSYGIDAK